MTEVGTTAKLVFEPPGPGSWAQDPVHLPRPVTRYWAETHPEPCKRGANDMARYYGMLIDGLEMAYVNGFAYSTITPAPEEAIPARFKRAEEVFQGKLWREQLREWDETCKPSSIAAHRELQAVDPDAFSDDELVAYLTRCRDHHAAMMFVICKQGGLDEGRIMAESDLEDRQRAGELVAKNGTGFHLARVDQSHPASHGVGEGLHLG